MAEVITRLRLIQLNERGVGTIHYLMKPVTSLGRAATNDIVINHKQVSRRHLLIRLDESGATTTATVEDCGSANGAFMNGEKIDAAIALEEGSTLTIGDIDFRVERFDPTQAGYESVDSIQFETHGTIDVADFNSVGALSASRNSELDALNLRNTDKDDAFDEIAQVAASVFGVKFGFVSVVGDANCFYKGAHGLNERTWKRSSTPCALVVEAHLPIWVGAMFPDEKVMAMPFMDQSSKFRFYAGAPYTGPSGIVIGTVGVVSESERSATPEHLQALANLAKCVERQITLELEKRRAHQLHLRLVEIKGGDPDDTH